jgi:hypothetical protein
MAVVDLLLHDSFGVIRPRTSRGRIAVAEGGRQSIGKSSRLSEFDHFPGTDGRSQMEGLGISRERGIRALFSGVLPFGVEEWVS